MSHHHHHGHHHHHHADTAGALSRMQMVFWFNFIFSLMELAGGWLSGSTVILSSAIHDLGDALAIGLAFFLEGQSQQKSTPTFSYGFRRLSILAAVITGVLMLVASLGVLGLGLFRLFSPSSPDVAEMAGFAALGVLVNGIAAWRMAKGKSLNEKMISWHLLQDLAGWVLVLLTAVILHWWKWSWLDPAMAILLSLWVMKNVVGSLKEGMKIFLQASPGDIPVEEMEKHLQSLPRIADVHHSHLWSLDGQSHVFTTHVVVKNEVQLRDLEKIKNEIKEELRKRYQVSEATIEIELPGEACADPQHSDC